MKRAIKKAMKIIKFKRLLAKVFDPRLVKKLNYKQADDLRHVFLK